MSPKPTRASAVAEFLSQLEHPLKAEIEVLRALILGTDGRVREAVKWNAPSFYITEHFATLKLHPTSKVQVIFHTGAKVQPGARTVEIRDPEGMLKWPANDRCVVSFFGMEEIDAKKEAFVAVVRQWIEQTAGVDGSTPGPCPA